MNQMKLSTELAQFLRKVILLCSDKFSLTRMGEKNFIYITFASSLFKAESMIATPFLFSIVVDIGRVWIGYVCTYVLSKNIIIQPLRLYPTHSPCCSYGC